MFIESFLSDDSNRAVSKNLPKEKPGETLNSAREASGVIHEKITKQSPRPIQEISPVATPCEETSER